MAFTHSPESGTQLLDHPGTDEAVRHRFPKQVRTGGPVLGVTAMAAALGATGLSAGPAAAAVMPAAPAPAVSAPDEASAADPGLALAARIQQQADHRATAADEAARQETARLESVRLEAAQEAAAKRAAQAESAALAAAEAASAVVRGAGQFVLPTAKYTLSAPSAGAHWAQQQGGLDFAAPTGTAVTALGTGTVTSAGWSGAYGYRVTQTLPDGTEVWYCHLSSVAVTTGEVAPGTPLGRVGATGSVTGPGTGPHLHLEIRPAGGAPVDPLVWLRQHGLNP